MQITAYPSSKQRVAGSSPAAPTNVFYKIRDIFGYQRNSL